MEGKQYDVGEPSEGRSSWINTRWGKIDQGIWMGIKMGTDASTKAFDLKKCLGCMEQTYIKKFGRKFQFDSMEAIFKGLKGTDNTLTYRMIKRRNRRQGFRM